MACVLSFPNRIGSASYSGGSWKTSLPVTNLAYRQLSRVARSASASVQDTTFTVDAASSIQVGVFGLFATNLTTSAQYKVEGSDTALKVSDRILDFTAGTLPGALTLTRSSTAMYQDASGVWQTAAINTVRPRYESGVAVGIILEGSSTNYLTYCRTLGLWSTISATISTSPSTGIDNTSSSCSRLTATGANGYCYRNITGLGAPTYARFSVFLRRITGTGTVYINGGTGDTVVAVTSTWTRFDVRSSSGATISVKLATSGDVVDIDYAMVEDSAVDGTNIEGASSPILTTSGSVTRSADVLNIPSSEAALVNLAAGSLFAKLKVVKYPSGSTPSPALYVGNAGATQNFGFGFYGAGYVTMTKNNTHPINTTVAVNTDVRVGMSWSATLLGSKDGSSTGAGGSTTNTGMAEAWTCSMPNHSSIVLKVLRVSATQAYSQTDLNTITGYTNLAGTPEYDSGWINAWHADWVSGTTAEQRDGVPGTHIHVLPSTQTYRYWRVTISDASNPDGWIEIGRAFMGPLWRPAINMIYGAGIGYEARETAVVSYSGAQDFAERPNPRVAKFGFDALTVAEAFGGILEMQRQLGTTKEFLFMWDEADTLQLPRRSFLANLRTLNPVEQPYYSNLVVSLEAKEIL